MPLVKEWEATVPDCSKKNQKTQNMTEVVEEEATMSYEKKKEKGCC